MAYGITNGNLHASIQDAPPSGPSRDSVLGVALVLSIPAIPLVLALITSLVCR